VILLLIIIDNDVCDDNYDSNGSVSSALLSVSMSAICGARSCCDGRDGIQVRNLAVIILNNQ